MHDFKKRHDSMFSASTAGARTLAATSTDLVLMHVNTGAAVHPVRTDHIKTSYHVDGIPRVLDSSRRAYEQPPAADAVSPNIRKRIAPAAAHMDGMCVDARVDGRWSRDASGSRSTGVDVHEQRVRVDARARAIFAPENSTADTPLPSSVDTNLLDSLNGTIGLAVPLVDSARSTMSAPNLGLIALVLLLFGLF
ncbi:hypothetical protein B0H13DRAFT_2316639 [Mycena leptocephala]|nr:hypothetical protein B0H13DRAFT_2316639 [Mycena leptocephala]